MKTKMLFFAIFISITQLIAVEKTSNYQIVGQVTDSGTGKHIPYSTITIVNDSTKLITKQCADGDGKFQLSTKENQKYTLTFSSVGYQEANIKTDANAPITNIGDATFTLFRLNLNKSDQYSSLITIVPLLIIITCDIRLYDYKMTSFNSALYINLFELITLLGCWYLIYRRLANTQIN